MIVMDYRTRDGLADYGFSIDFDPGRGWRVYIIFQPFQQGHDDRLQLPYQAIDGNGRRYVDWSEKVDSLADAKTVAELWAEVAQRYQRTQERKALYVELIEHYQRTQEQTRVTPAGPDHLGDAVGAGGAGPGHQDRGPVIPHPRPPAGSSSDLQGRESNTQTAARAASAMAARTGDTTAPERVNSATPNTDSADGSGHNRKPGIGLRLAAGALLHRRPTRVRTPVKCEQSTDS
jgi:hypothetical protein